MRGVKLVRHHHGLAGSVSAVQLDADKAAAHRGKAKLHVDVRIEVGLHLVAPAQRLRIEADIPPRLVEQARAEFDATVARIPEIEDGRISSAIVTTQIAWEVERMQRSEAA